MLFQAKFLKCWNYFYFAFSSKLVWISKIWFFEPYNSWTLLLDLYHCDFNFELKIALNLKIDFLELWIFEFMNNFAWFLPLCFQLWAKNNSEFQKFEFWTSNLWTIWIALYHCHFIFQCKIVLDLNFWIFAHFEITDNFKLICITVRTQAFTKQKSKPFWKNGQHSFCHLRRFCTVITRKKSRF